MYPQLARTYGPRYSTFPCFCQPKLNGVRALYQSGFFQSRDGKLWKTPVLEHLRSELSLLSHELGDTILDGELYVHGWKLQRINGAVATNRSEPREDTHEVEFHVFDCIHPRSGGFDQPFSSRYLHEWYPALQQLQLPHIRPVPTGFIYLREEVDYHFNQYTALGYEGIMLRPDGPYVPGEHEGRNGPTQRRSPYLWKHKAWQDDEFLCVGVTAGKGKASIGIGALVLERYWQTDKGEHLVSFEVGTGFDDEERRQFAAKPPLGKQVRVRYLEFTTDGRPFNPSFIAVME